MKILSLFDGISCGQQASKELGVGVETYYSSEIDKYAIAITQYNFPNTIQLGDINDWRKWDIDWKDIDLVMGGSPCQGFSFAGKQLNFDDPRSKLFFVFVDILNQIKKHNPDVRFLLENVRMKQEYQDVISKLLGVEAIMINSALVSAQNRVRLYWFNWEVEQPKDRGILLKDVLDREPKVTIREKSKTVRSSGLKSYDRHEWDSVGDEGTALYWRKLTPLECERLQTLPDNFSAKGIMNGKEVNISNTQRHKALGNGWTVEVIKHILKKL
jgi:site-specific DNA-cytosine methylase